MHIFLSIPNSNPTFVLAVNIPKPIRPIVVFHGVVILVQYKLQSVAGLQRVR